MTDTETEQKPMVYSKNPHVSVLAKGKTEEGVYWVVVNGGTHPCSYIGVPKGHKLYGKSDEEINLDVHGGITFTEYDLHWNPVLIDLWWIGWDYAHAGDYLGWDELLGLKEIKEKYPEHHSKKWTTKELVEEIRGVLKEL